jgi:hypothetical protein
MANHDCILMPFYYCFCLPNLASLNIATALNDVVIKPRAPESPACNDLVWPLCSSPDMANLITLRLNCTSASTSTLELLLRRTLYVTLLSYQVQAVKSYLNFGILRTSLDHVRKTLIDLIIRFAGLNTKPGA